MRILLALAVALLITTPAQAQDLNTLLDIPEGMTLLNVSASESVEIEQDLLTANLRYEAENKDPAALQNEINSLMNKAVDEAKKIKNVKAATQGYNVYQYNRSQDKTRQDMIWKGQQALILKSTNADELLKLTGELQKLGLAMNGLSYSVSPELLEETRNGLLEDALKKLQEKAERTAKAIGKSQTELLQINVDNGGYYPQPRMVSMVKMEGFHGLDMAPPVATPGEDQISLTVSAQVLLK